ncbi:MAG: hypothetical protein AABY15_00580 [Nanoarchaeota archaeon]
MDNVRKIIREVLTELMDKTDSYTSFLAAKKYLKLPNLYLHFTDVNKLGINPQKSHADPHAIYFYPAKWILNEDNWAIFQYAVIKDFFFLCQVDTSNFLEISTITESQADSLMKRAGLYDMWKQYGKDFDKKPARRFWEFLDMLNVEPNKRDNKDHWSLPKVTWTQFWKTTGYDGFSDNKGIVNTGEPRQIGVFNPKTIKIIESGENVIASSTHQLFYDQIIRENNINVIEQRYIQNGEYYRIYGTSGGNAVDIRINPSEMIGFVYYSDENGQLYKQNSEYSIEPNRARDSIMYAVKKAVESANNPVVNLDREKNIRIAAEKIFKNVTDYKFKSFGTFDKSPMVFVIRDDNNIRNAYFTSTLGYDKNGNMVLEINFSVDKKLVAGDPLDVFASVVDKFPDAGEEVYAKEMAKYGISYPDMEYINKPELEEPTLKIKMKVKNPEDALKKVRAEFEKFMKSHRWAKPKKSILSSVAMAAEDKVRMWFDANVN